MALARKPESRISYGSPGIGNTIHLASALFNAHDNSALRVPLVVPQGVWAFGISAFVVMGVVLLAESVTAMLMGDAEAVDALLGSRTLEDETAEALEAVAMAKERA